MPVFPGKLADVFGKIWACFFRTSGTFFLRIGKYFHLSAHFSPHPHNTLSLLIARHTFLAR